MDRANLIEVLAAAQAVNRRAEVTKADLAAHADKSGYGWWKIGAFTVYEKHDSTAPIETATYYTVAAPKPKRASAMPDDLLTTPEEAFGGGRGRNNGSEPA